MSVSLTPTSSLGFNRPFSNVVKRILTVTNNNDHPVAFKVKTTAPRLYCVRPNSGRIEPGENTEVQVLLQAMKEDPPLNVKCKDKFLVQSTIISPEKETLSLHDFWATLDGQESPVHQQKIKVVYLPPEGTVEEEEEPSYFAPVASDQEGLSQSQLPNASGTLYQTTRDLRDTNGHAPIPSFDTAPGLPRSVIPAELQAPVDRTVSPALDYTVAREASQEEEPEHTRVSVPPSPPPAAPAIINVNVHAPPTPPSPPPFVEQHSQQSILPPSLTQAQSSYAETELRNQLLEAQAEIQRLRTLLAAAPDPNSDGLRYRGSHSVADDESTAPPSVIETETTYVGHDTILQQDGVPPQVVAMIALGVFVTTYLFF